MAAVVLTFFIARKLFDAGESVSTEVSGHLMKVGGLFSLGISFAADGNLIMSDLNFLRVFPSRREGSIDIGLIRLKPGADPIGDLIRDREQDDQLDQTDNRR